MTSSNLVLALSLFSFIVLAIVPSTNAQNSPQDFVSLHNSARAAVGVGPVSWDDTVAAYAQNYANQRIGDCQLVHSGGPYGENIFWGSGRDYSAADAVNAWVSEKQYYDYNSNTCASGHVCGHYTLVVWANSMKIGCARVRCNSGAIFITCNYSPRIYGWSFVQMPEAQLPNHVILPLLHKERGNTKILVTWLPITLCLLLLTVVATVFIVWRRKKYAELLDDWELEYGPHRFKYKDLFLSTQGFKEKELMGAGGFGRVYKGVLPTSKVQVAVKKVSHESRQGMKEFVAEIVSIGRLRHRNLVQLLGYCRRKGELLLVYDFMPNGSLDKFLYDRNKPILNWDQRFQIIKGVAAGLLYLHEEWEKVVVHRDIKASNVLLDSELNGRLGDFGLAKLCDRGSDPQTTNVVGTMGYIAPEFARTGKATTATDVFAFGAFLLEVGCGRRPIKPHAEEDELVLVDWVLANWQKGLVLETRDPRLGEEYCAHEIELVLKLGLLCSHPMPTARPNMRQVMQILEGDSALPELCPSYMSFSTLLLPQNEEFDGHIRPFSSPVGSISGVSGGR